MNLIYVNGSDRNPNTPLGRLMHDFSEPDSDKMYCTILAERARFLKYSLVEVDTMNATIERLFAPELQAARVERRAERREDGIEESIINIISHMLKLGQLAFNTIAQNTGVRLQKVQDIAKSLGISESH